MKNIYGQTVQPRYEVCIEHNMGTTIAPDWREDCNNNVSVKTYREAVKEAKRLSLDLANKPMCQVYICCYYKDSISVYNQVWWEYYTNGKKDERIINE